MEILLNELSLHSQFINEEDFFNSLEHPLKIIKLIDILSFKLLKKYDFYSYKVTNNLNLSQILRIKSNDKITRFKSLLLKVMNDPTYWEDDKKYSHNDKYICELTDLIYGYSLAESCERDKIVLSFKSSFFSDEFINIKKNEITFEIYNSIEKNKFLDYLYEQKKISEIFYCKHRFRINLSFLNLNNETMGFNILEPEEKKAFINTFSKFSEMTWEQILNDKGLKYKKYNANDKNNIFASTSYNDREIYKFKTSKKYRCFGYRENNIFYVLKFERDHKVSDKG